MDPGIEPLFNRTLVLVAHPDDECVGAGALLQRTQDPLVVFATDGGPRDSSFWQQCGSREEYVELRRNEARQAGSAVRAQRQEFLPIVDQELYLNLDSALRTLQRLTLVFRPDAILTLAYEGGHPDHDCCAFLGYVLGLHQNVPVWEMPLYHRTREGPRQQQFLQQTTQVHHLRIDSGEFVRKEDMRSCYRSQFNVIAGFDLSCESFRPQPAYDFFRTPNDVINYEFWKWPITAAQVCESFASFQQLGRPAIVP